MPGMHKAAEDPLQVNRGCKKKPETKNKSADHDGKPQGLVEDMEYDPIRMSKEGPCQRLCVDRLRDEEKRAREKHEQEGETKDQDKRETWMRDLEKR